MAAAAQATTAAGGGAAPATAVATATSSAQVKDDSASLFEVVRDSFPKLDLLPLGLITGYASATGKLDTWCVISHLMSKHGLNIDEADDEFNHVGCEECLKATKPRPEGVMTLPDSLEANLFHLADLSMTSHGDDYGIHSFYDMISGVTVLERESVPDRDVICFDIIFYHEPWYRFTTSYKEFQERPILDVTKFLSGKGYQLKTDFAPERGDVVIYVHGDKATHYGRVARVANNAVYAISKQGGFHVIQGQIECAPKEYGLEFVLMKPLRWFPALYTSPAKIRAQNRGVRGVASS